MDWHFSERTSVHTTQNPVCATSPTLLDGFCSYPYTVTNMTMEMTVKTGFCDAASFSWVMELCHGVCVCRGGGGGGGRPCPTFLVLTYFWGFWVNGNVYKLCLHGYRCSWGYQFSIGVSITTERVCVKLQEWECG